MAEITFDGPEPAKLSPLACLQNIPISRPYIAMMTRLLNRHGATLAETADCSDAAPPYKQYTITFPPGTRRSFGLRMRRSRYFTIHFPDGFHLPGGELWPLAVEEDDRAVIVLYLPDG